MLDIMKLHDIFDMYPFHLQNYYYFWRSKSLAINVKWHQAKKKKKAKKKYIKN